MLETRINAWEYAIKRRYALRRWEAMELGQRLWDKQEAKPPEIPVPTQAEVAGKFLEIQASLNHLESQIHRLTQKKRTPRGLY